MLISNIISGTIVSSSSRDTYSVILDGEGVVAAYPDSEPVSEMYNYVGGTKTVVFAVVADEVRNLAGKSAEAAKSTTALIENALAPENTGRRL